MAHLIQIPTHELNCSQLFNSEFCSTNQNKTATTTRFKKKKKKFQYFFAASY